MSTTANLRFAYGYLRVSGLSQAADDRGGLPRQRIAIESHARSLGIEIKQWFEEAHTGTDLERRPAFRRMREAILSNGIRVVVIEKLDRLARDVMIQEGIFADFRKHGITLISATAGEEDLCSSDPTRKFIRQVLGAVAELDRSLLVARMRAGKSRVRSTGKRCGGRSPYGQHAKHPEEVEIVNRIHHLKRNGFNLSRIADVLNSDGKRTRKGTNWTTTQIGRILRRTA